MSGWVAIVGSDQTGKRDVVAALRQSARSRGVSVGGFYQEAIRDGGEVVGYDLVGIRDSTRVPLARPSGDPRLCDWGFSTEAFDRARDFLLAEGAALVLAELGPLEAAEAGHWPAVVSALARGDRLVVLCIRPRALTPLALRLPDPVDAIELPATFAEIETWAAAVVGLARHGAPSGSV